MFHDPGIFKVGRSRSKPLTALLQVRRESVHERRLRASYPIHPSSIGNAQEGIVSAYGARLEITCL
jgi:hypothetical protein